MAKKTTPNKDRFFRKRSLDNSLQLLDEIKKMQNTPKDDSKGKRLLQNWTNIFAGIIVPITVFIITYRQTDILARQAQQIQGFDTLLRNTNRTNQLIAAQLQKIDTQLVISRTMLARSMRIYENEDAGNMNRFAGAIYRLGELLTEYKRTAATSEMPEQYLATNAKEILGGELNNSYLSQNTSTMKKWVDAYRHACAYMESTFNMQFGDEFGSDGNSRVKEVGAGVETDFASTLHTLNVAFEAGGEYLKKDERFLK